MAYETICESNFEIFGIYLKLWYELLMIVGYVLRIEIISGGQW